MLVVCVLALFYLKEDKLYIFVKNVFKSTFDNIIKKSIFWGKNNLRVCVALSILSITLEFSLTSSQSTWDLFLVERKNK